MLKELKKALLIKVFALFFGVFTIIFTLAYALIKNFLQNHLHRDELNTFLYEYNLIWFEIVLVFLLLSTVAYFVLRNFSKRVEHDANAIGEYLQEINDKNYNAVIKIEYFVEFLHTSILLKNIVKRLESKKSK